MRRFVVALAVSLVVGAAVPPVVAGAQPASIDWLSGVNDSADIADDALVLGQVRDADGRAVTGHAALVAFPPQEVLAKTKLGGSIRLRSSSAISHREPEPSNSRSFLRPVAKTTIGRNGRFALRLDPSASAVR